MSVKTIVILLILAGAGISVFLYNSRMVLLSGAPESVAVTSVADSPAADSSNATVTSKKEFTVTGQNFSFSPSELAVNKGDSVKIIFKNSGGIHDLKIDEFNAATKRIRSDEEETIEFTADKAGSFEYYCSVGEHRAMGMKGTLTVN